MKLKVFYHPELMDSDKSKMLLAGNYTKEGGIYNYQTHYAAILVRVAMYVKNAMEDGEDIPGLVEDYLNHSIESGDAFSMAYQILSSPQMQSLLRSSYEKWNKIGAQSLFTPIETLRDTNIGTLHLVDEEGQRQTEELIEDMTLRHFLEQLSMIDQEYE